MEIQVFRNENSSQTNAYSPYSNDTYSGLIPNERALSLMNSFDDEINVVIGEFSGEEWLAHVTVRLQAGVRSQPTAWLHCPNL